MKHLASIRFEQSLKKWQLRNAQGHLVCQASERATVVDYANSHDFVIGVPKLDGTLTELLQELKQ